MLSEEGTTDQVVATARITAVKNGRHFDLLPRAKGGSAGTGESSCCNLGCGSFRNVYLVMQNAMEVLDGGSTSILLL
jgi:hypothetical protein